jgi:immunity protein 57 of polymorphic toxin system
MDRLRCFHLFAFAIVTTTLMPLPADCQSVSRERRELKMADQAILATIAVSSSPKGRHLCSENELACVGPSKAELGLSLIGARQTKASREALIDLLGYRLDGSVAEDYSCYVLKAGTPMKGELLKVKPESLITRCHAELDKLTRSRKATFEGSDQNAVCADFDNIKVKVKELTEGITKGAKCDAADF